MVLLAPPQVEFNATPTTAVSGMAFIKPYHSPQNISLKRNDSQQSKIKIMKASLQRKIMRWIHIVLSIPVIGYIYGPVAHIPRAAMMVKWVIFPFLVISGLWLWKGHLVRRWFRTKFSIVAVK